MNIEEKIKEAMARFIERAVGAEQVTVTSWNEEFDVYAFGGCGTCGPEYTKEYSVDIFYAVPGKSHNFYGFKGTFTELIGELDKNE